MPVHVVEYSEVFSEAEIVYKGLMDKIPYKRENSGILFLYGREDDYEETGSSKACMSFSSKNALLPKAEWYQQITRKFDALMYKGFETAYDASKHHICLPGGFASHLPYRHVFAAHGLGWQLEEILVLSVMFTLNAITEEHARVLLDLSKNPYAKYVLF